MEVSEIIEARNRMETNILNEIKQFEELTERVTVNSIVIDRINIATVDQELKTVLQGVRTEITIKRK